MIQPFHWLLYALYLPGLLWLIKRHRFFNLPVLDRNRLCLFFGVKVAAGILLTVIYTYYYTHLERNDIYRYFSDSTIISRVLFQHPVIWLKIMLGIDLNSAQVFPYIANTQYFSHPSSDFITNNTLIIRINVLLNYLSGSCIWINTLFLNFLSFVGLVALYKVLQPYFKGSEPKLYVPLFLLPSVVFWSSGNLKETVFYMAFGFWLKSFLVLNHRALSLKYVIMLLVTTWLMLSVKVQVPAALALCAVVYGVLAHKGVARAGYSIVLIVMVLTGLYYAPSSCELIGQKRNEFIELAQTQHTGSFIVSQPCAETCEALFSLLPQALVGALARPFLGFSSTAFQWAFAIENALFLLLVTILAVGFGKVPHGPSRNLAVLFLLFAFTQYIVIGLTVPIEGALVHYRIVASPFLLLGVLLCTDMAKLKQAIGRIL